MKVKQSITLFIQTQSRSNYQWKWHWWCVSSNLYYSYIKHIKIFRKRFRLDYWFNHWTQYRISKYNPLAGSSYIKLLKELDHPRKELINIQNIDGNECFNPIPVERGNLSTPPLPPGEKVKFTKIYWNWRLGWNFHRTKFSFEHFLKIWAYFVYLIKNYGCFVINNWHNYSLVIISSKLKLVY